MYTPSDADWIIKNRKREIYKVSEARWLMEGLIVYSPNSDRSLLKKLKALISCLKPSQIEYPLIRMSARSDITTIQNSRPDLTD